MIKPFLLIAFSDLHIYKHHFYRYLQTAIVAFAPDGVRGRARRIDQMKQVPRVTGVCPD
ncbi:hypothetical protein [Pseudomonas syringae]|uniref:hypothetical protein n=1 Tax=Pseudomonas syringae TaxID=317 RepID=UPI001379DFA3|nr:hypothetical protein [Pseudomonas syringae]